MKTVIIQYSEDDDPVIDIMLTHHGAMLHAKSEITNGVIFYQNTTRAKLLTTGFITLFNPVLKQPLPVIDIKDISDIERFENFASITDSILVLIIPFNKGLTGKISPNESLEGNIVSAIILNDHKYQETIYP